MHTRKPILILALALLAGSGAARASAIHEASGKGDLAAVKAAVAAKPASVSERDSKKATPLHYAAAGGHTAVVEYLVSRKADVNARKPDGVTPLHVAAAMGRTAAARALLTHGAKRDAKDNTGRTPLSIAQAKGFHGLVTLLQPKPATKSAAKSTAKPAARPAGKPAAAASDLEARTLGVISSLEADNYAAVTRQFDSTMSAAMPPAKLEQVWQGLKAQLGPFRRLGKVRTGSVNQNGVAMTVVVVPGVFGDTPLNVQVAYKKDGTIGGFFVLKPDASM